MLGKQEGCVLFLLCTPPLGPGPPVLPWDDDMARSLVSQPQLHPLLGHPHPSHGCQSNNQCMPSLAHTFPAPLGAGVQAPWPVCQASKQLSSPIRLCPPSHPACQSKLSRSLHRLSFELRIPPLALPGRLAFSPRHQAGDGNSPCHLPSGLGPPHLCSGNTCSRVSVGKWLSFKLEG